MTSSNDASGAAAAPYQAAGSLQGRTLLISGGSRGIGLAMAHRAMGAGRDAGMCLGALQATAMGYPIYRKLGFVELLRCHMLVRPAR